MRSLACRNSASWERVAGEAEEAGELSYVFKIFGSGWRLNHREHCSDQTEICCNCDAY